MINCFFANKISIDWYFSTMARLLRCDPVRGVRHFATGIDCGLEILNNFRSTLSSLAVPTFAIDLPEGGGKVALQPDYRIDGKYPDIHGRKLIKYEDHFSAKS